MGYIKDSNMYTFDNQIFDKKSLEKLKKKEHIFYKSGWCMPIKVEKGNKKNHNTMIKFIAEDDGTIYDKPYFEFNSCWIDQIIDGLVEVRDYLKMCGLWEEK